MKCKSAVTFGDKMLDDVQILNLITGKKNRTNSTLAGLELKPRPIFFCKGRQQLQTERPRCVFLNCNTSSVFETPVKFHSLIPKLKKVKQQELAYRTFNFIWFMRWHGHNF